MKKRFYCIMLSVLMVLSALLPAFRVSAEERGKNISPDVNITKFTIENWKGKEVDKLSKWSRFKIKLDWNAQNQIT